MKITSVRIRKLEDAGTTKAIATAVINDEIAIHRIRVIEGRRGLFVALQAVKGADGEYRDIVHPVTAEGRKMLNEAVLDAYHNVLRKEQGFESLYQDGYEFKIVPGEEPVLEKASTEPPFRNDPHQAHETVGHNQTEYGAPARAGNEPSFPSGNHPNYDAVRSDSTSQMIPNASDLRMEKPIPERPQQESRTSESGRSSIKSQLADAEKMCASQPAKQAKETPVLG